MARINCFAVVFPFLFVFLCGTPRNHIPRMFIVLRLYLIFFSFRLQFSWRSEIVLVFWAMYYFSIQANTGRFQCATNIDGIGRQRGNGDVPVQNFREACIRCNEPVPNIFKHGLDILHGERTRPNKPIGRYWITNAKRGRLLVKKDRALLIK